MAFKDQLKQLWDSFSIRKPSQGASTFKPDILSDTLRNRILMLYTDVMSGRMNDKLYRLGHEDHRVEFWEEMHHSLRHLYGRPVLASQQVQSAAEDALRFVQSCNAEEFFDFIELSFKVQCATRALQDENDFVDALNEIFRRENAPYQVTPGVFRVDSEADRKSRPVGPVVGTAGVILGGGRVRFRVAFPRVVRVDEEVPHSEAVLPALAVLSRPEYAGANDEFRKALEDYRKGDFEDCLVKCGSAFESTLKVLCGMNHVTFDPNKDTAGPLLDKLLVKSQLDTGTFKEPLIVIGRMRNRLSAAHGGGSTVKTVPRHVAQYAVTITAAAIALLVHDMGK